MSKKKQAGSLAVWDPFAEFEPFAGLPFHGVERMRGDMWGPGRGGFAPAVDVTENGDSYVVTAELPGTKKDDVNVEVHDGRLTIRGEKRSKREQKDEHHRHVERSFGTFSRSFSLPPNADADQVSARFEDGVLTVKVHKTEETKPKTVNIKS